MVNLNQIFICPYDLQFLFIFKFLCPKEYVFEIFTLIIIHLDFVSFLFRTFK
jgi:hypothetical protein